MPSDRVCRQLIGEAEKEVACEEWWEKALGEAMAKGIKQFLPEKLLRLGLPTGGGNVADDDLRPFPARQQSQPRQTVAAAGQHLRTYPQRS